MIVESLLIVAVTTFYFPVMLRGSWTNSLMGDSQLFTENIKRMFSVGFLGMCELRSVIGLENQRRIPEIENGFF